MRIYYLVSSLLFVVVLYPLCTTAEWTSYGANPAYTFHSTSPLPLLGTNNSIFYETIFQNYTARCILMDYNNICYMSTDLLLIAFSLSSNVIIWETSLNSPQYNFSRIFGCPVLANDKIYVQQYHFDYYPHSEMLSLIVSLNSVDGSITWTTPIYPFTSDQGNQGLVYVPNSNLLVITNTYGQYTSLVAYQDHGNSFSIAWNSTFSFNETIGTYDVPMVGPTGDIIIAQDFQGCLGVMNVSGINGNLNWVTCLPRIYGAKSCGVTSENVCILQCGEDVMAIDGNGNANIVGTSLAYLNVLAVYYSDVIICLYGTFIARIDPLTLTVKWNITHELFHEQNFQLAAISGNETLYVRLQQDVMLLFAINVSNGEVMWYWGTYQFNSFDPLSTPMVPYDNKILLLTYRNYGQNWFANLLRFGCCSSNGICTSTGCECYDNYYTFNCSVMCDANLTCTGHGECGETGECICAENYFSQDCSLKCTRSETCSSHGTCSPVGNCSCDLHFIGENCSVLNFTCIHGEYNPSKAKCQCPSKSFYQNYTGLNCESVEFSYLFYVMIGGSAFVFLVLVIVAIVVIAKKRKRREYWQLN